MNIGIIVALKDELLIDKKLITNFKKKKINGIEVVYFIYKKNNIVLAYSGVGKTNASHCTAFLINNHKLDLLINIGSAGGLSNDVKVSDIIIPNRLYYLDVDACCFGYELGQVPREKPYFELDKKLVLKAESIIRKMDFNVIVSYFGTSDTFISKNNFKKFLLIKKAPIVGSDMEATSIIHVANKYKVKTLFIKIISDSIIENNSSLKWKEEVSNVKAYSFMILLKLIEGLNGINK